jgi:hypothetical protein
MQDASCVKPTASQIAIVEHQQRTAGLEKESSVLEQRLSAALQSEAADGDDDQVQRCYASATRSYLKP